MIARRFVAFADADDVVLPESYARMIAALTASSGGNEPLVFSGFTAFGV